MNRPSPGTMVYWRFKGQPGPYHFGYCTYVSGCNMVRMGRWNGDTCGGVIVDIYETEWSKYNNDAY